MSQSSRFKLWCKFCLHTTKPTSLSHYSCYEAETSQEAKIGLQQFQNVLLLQLLTKNSSITVEFNFFLHMHINYNARNRS